MQDKTVLFLALILAYIDKQGSRAVEALELAQGVIAVKDTKGVVGIYFDQADWKLTNPRVWQGVPDLGDGLGLLPGIGIKKLDAVEEYVQSHLCRITPPTLWKFATTLTLP